jgi:hypothetical protein
MKTRTRILLAAIFSQGLCGLAIAESWITTGSGTGDPLTFNGSAGTVVSIDGFRTDMVGSGTPYNSPYAIAWGSGVGVERNSSDRHTIGNNADNFNWTDGILLSFSDKLVSISEVTLTSQRGWSGSDARDQDFELWAFTGAGAGALPTASYSMWHSNGWTRVADVDGHMADANYNMLTKTYATSNSVHSTHWIVLAANADHNKDAFKFKGFSGSTKCIPGTPGCNPPPGGGPGQVPVPGTLALLAIGALAIRRKLAKA